MDKFALKRRKCILLSDWYVLHVTTGKEFSIKQKIEKYSPHYITMTIFQREIIHSRMGKKVKVLGPLFSGYIFVYKHINEVCELAYRYCAKEYIYPVSINNKPCQVYNEEMELLLQSADGNGTFKLSYGHKVGDKVEVTDGPLKNLQGKISWIDEKKKKAKVEIFLFKRTMRVNLGLLLFTQNSSIN